MYKQLLAGLACSLMAVAGSAGEPAPQVLGDIVQRNFLYSVGLSEPGTLGVAHVRYQVVIQDAWHSTIVPGDALQVVTSGGCLSLLQPGQRYLLTLTPAASDAKAAGVAWAASCETPTEAQAQADIERLNQARRLQASTF
ncbi:hypothetical protein [Simiduia aestuariiviva]|uniref:Uncharacterized protein n=1 Tax=Simiduia aestuariiviva TaxID=1510459 RepID=A0A839UPU4_9GAMM|nr:hypothetical protein [Simiduia aestuariiviva]MBB3167826.1 hypothetical protein [Simiduia aestuariiviva]